MNHHSETIKTARDALTDRATRLALSGHMPASYYLNLAATHLTQALELIDKAEQEERP